MRSKLLILSVLVIAAAATGCKKKGDGGGGGGGGGWFVGTDAMMVNVNPQGHLGTPYDVGGTDALYGIACRYRGEAWVVGAHGTLLYTDDGGASWASADVPTNVDLRALATQDAGPVFVAGDGVFLTSNDTGAHWTQLGDGTTKFRSLAAAQEGAAVLALADDGALWSLDSDQRRLVLRAALPGAHAVAVSPDGETAMIAGNGLYKSLDAGASWIKLAVDPSLRFEDVRVDRDGEAVAVGAGGVVANIAADGSVVTQRLGTADLHTLHIADSDDESEIGYAAGEGGQVYVTSDSGLTWSAGPNIGTTVFGVDEIGAGHR